MAIMKHIWMQKFWTNLNRVILMDIWLIFDVMYSKCEMNEWLLWKIWMQDYEEYFEILAIWWKFWLIFEVVFSRYIFFLFEMFHNLDIEVINVEIKALHQSALLLFEMTKIKEKLQSLFQKFAVKNDVTMYEWGNCITVQIRKMQTTDYHWKKIKMWNMDSLRIVEDFLNWEKDWDSWD